MNLSTQQTSAVSKVAGEKHEALVPAVAALNFERLKFKYTGSSEAEMSAKEWDFAEQEYRRFLSLKVMYPNQALVPSKMVDKVWHAHILDTRAYREDCESVFGRFIDHYPYFGIYGKDDHQMLVDTFAETVAVYEKHYGPYPSREAMNASRCQDHACHVPTECACRVEGACK